MPCLYVSTSEIHGTTFVKFGISKFDEPWIRVSSHSESRDNPFGTKTRHSVWLCIPFECVKDARAVEGIICTGTKSLLPELREWESHPPMSLPALHGTAKPSGEWVVYPGDKRNGVCDLLDIAIVAIRSHLEDRWRAGVFACAYEAVCRAAFGFHSGCGYMQTSLIRSK